MESFKVCYCTLGIENPNACLSCTSGNYTSISSNYYLTTDPFDWNSLVRTAPLQYRTSEEDKIWTVDVVVPGLEIEDINIKVKKDALTIDVEDGKFNNKETLVFNFDYEITPDMITSELEKGILVVVVTKPEDLEFKVEIC